MQSKLEALTARVTEAEECISESEDGLVEENTKTEASLKKIHAHERRLREITDSMKWSSVRIIGIHERVEKNRGLEDIFEEYRLPEITESMKCSNVRIISIPEGVEKNRGLEEKFEQIVAENFPNLARETNIRVQEAERTPPSSTTTNLSRIMS